MGSARAGLAGAVLNVSIVVVGLTTVFLLYSLVTRSFFPRTDAVREANPAHLVGEILQVEVRNGCGVSGLAATATLFLREHGFDVVEVGDFERFDVEHSAVVDRVGDLEAAKKIASALGIDETQVRQEIRPDLYLDATVILGKDYASLRPFESTDLPQPTR
ncbi:MAG TPA: LytR C-terminal domain-containing protein [Rhodothermales bacterium]